MGKFIYTGYVYVNADRIVCIDVESSKTSGLIILDNNQSVCFPKRDLRRILSELHVSESQESEEKS